MKKQVNLTRIYEYELYTIDINKKILSPNDDKSDMLQMLMMRYYRMTSAYYHGDIIPHLYHRLYRMIQTNIKQ